MPNSFKFTVGNIQYILTQLSPQPVGIRDGSVLSRIEAMKDPVTQAEQVLIKKPFQKYNAAVAFIMCQYIAERVPPKEKPDGLIGKYKMWIDLITKV